MTLEKLAYQYIRQLGYWDCTERINPHNPTNPWSLAWSNPSTTADPDTMFQIAWLLSSSARRQQLSPTDVRILDRTAADLVYDGQLLPATKSYVKYLWQQVIRQECPHELSSGESA